VQPEGLCQQKIPLFYKSNITNLIRNLFHFKAIFGKKHCVSEAIGIRGLRTEKGRFRNVMFVSKIAENGKTSL
jgi:hypothetical protein